MKAKFLLPGFVNNNNCNKLPLNLLMVQYMKDNKNKDKFYNCEINAFYDCFNGITWQGGRALQPPKNTFISILDCRDIIETINNLNIGVRMIYTNSLLQEKHLYDVYANDITEILASNPLNSVVAVMPMLRDYLKKKYPKLTIGLSTTKCITTSEDINKELQEWDFVTPDFHINGNFKELAKITNPEKLEILVNDSCDPECTYRKKHYEVIAKTHINYGIHLNDKNSELACKFPKYKGKPNLTTIKTNPLNVVAEDIYNKYIPINIQVFKITEREQPPIAALEGYIHYLVKPEYQMDVYSDIMSISGLNNIGA